LSPRGTLKYKGLLFREYSEQDHAISFLFHAIFLPLLTPPYPSFPHHFSPPLFYTTISGHLPCFSDLSPDTSLNFEFSGILPEYSNKRGKYGRELRVKVYQELELTSAELWWFGIRRRYCDWNGLWKMREAV